MKLVRVFCTPSKVKMVKLSLHCYEGILRGVKV